MILIAGCGYVGGRLAQQLVEADEPVVGLKRDPSTLPAGVEGIAADVSDPATLRDLPAALGAPLDALVYAVAPAGRSEADYRAAYVDGLRNMLSATRSLLSAASRASGRPARVVLVSSTGVYGQEDGRWVDEDTAPEPGDVTGRILLEGERLIEDLPGAGTVLRLGGIYGPGRTRLVRKVLDGGAGCPPPDRYGNRIHRDDAAAAIRHLLDMPDPAPVYIGVDTEPAALREVYQWIARRADVPDPCAADAPESSDPTPRRGTNKRCSSRRLLDSGFEFRFPTFREGYGPIVDELTG